MIGSCSRRAPNGLGRLARLANEPAAALYDAGEDAAESVNIAKLASADASLLALDQAIQTRGRSGFTSEGRPCRPVIRRPGAADRPGQQRDDP